MSLSYFATAPKGLTRYVVGELRTLGATQIQDFAAGVAFSGNLELGYRVCMWSRTSNRILVKIGEGQASDEAALYELARAINWDTHFAVDATFSVDYTAKGESFRHNQFCGLKIKDAIADYFRDRCGRRPSVDSKQPNIRINAFARAEQVTFYVDLSGASLHQRGYRRGRGEAPLKENLAAAVLLRADWPFIASKCGAFLDPMCGSGTLAIEAAMIAADRAPGLLRQAWGFDAWRGHSDDSWRKVVDEAKSRERECDSNRLPPIYASDQDGAALALARENASRAKVEKLIHFERRNLQQWDRPLADFGLLVTNPPYGERLSDNHTLTPLYGQLGALINQPFKHWRYGVLAAESAPTHALGLQNARQDEFFNGALPCTLLCGGAKRARRPDEIDEPTTAVEAPEISAPNADMLGNRLRKNIKEAGKWALKNGIECYRVYDADMPEFSFAIDMYQGEQRWLHVQEYAPPQSIDEQKAALRRQTALQVIPHAFDIPRENVFFKFRQRQRHGKQYEKLDEQRKFYIVNESDAKLWVNFTDYLDTGLFLDHRITRQLVRELGHKKRVLNLFAYTGSASVHAALGGAREVTTVDMSTTYTDWAKRNFTLNDLRAEQYQFIQADCFQWIETAAQMNRKFDLIFLDPPTASRSKRMEQSFDVQRDHEALITQAMKLLANAGIMIFSTNAQRFKLANGISETWTVENVSASTVPWDFRRNPKIHQCWKIFANTI